MKKRVSVRRRHWRGPRGFALVISLSLMVLMTVIVVGLLGLSSVAMRSGANGNARAEAEANARLALAAALGELQVKLGPDQRISARASALGGSVQEPNVVGAWESWSWAPGEQYAEKEQKFLGWLASSRGGEQRAESEDWPKSSFADAVTLLSARGGASGGQELRAELVDLTDEKRWGAYAWAVMDESQKAPMHLQNEEAKTNGEILARRVAPMTANPELALAELTAERMKQASKLVSVESVAVATGLGAQSQVPRQQQNLTSYSLGLLTNVIDGGLRKDLTTVFEDAQAPQEFLKEVAPYGDKLSLTAGVPSWAYLKSHYRRYMDLTATASNAPVYQVKSTSEELKPDNRNVQQVEKGIYNAPESERLLPVIAKFQIMFSVVAHHSHIPDRVNFFNEKGSPQGNTNYGAPHLVYDPVVTLYNPYDVALDIQRLRMRISDPPVLFGFAKNGIWLRDEFAAANGAGFHPLTRFQIANERLSNPPPRYFTLIFGGGHSENYSGRIRLEPGEVKVFAPRVENSWNWGNETAGGYTPRAFFDWDAGRNLGNIDGRTGNPMGVETVAGWDPRAGLQTDHLSYASRPTATLYDFERSNNWNGGWLGIKTTDRFQVYAKAGPPNTSGGDGDFSVSLLGASDADTSRDILRTYRFKFRDVTGEISANAAQPILSRDFLVRDLLQVANDVSPGGKSPFAILSMTAKTTRATMDQSMPWLHNHPVVEGVVQDTTKVDNALNSYDVRFEEVSDFLSSGGIEFDPTTKRGYFGASSTAQEGVSNVPMFRVPVTPMASLGELVPANLTPSAQLPRVTHAFGNSRAHPMLPTSAIRKTGGELGDLYDHSYLLNEALWDRYYFSTVAEYRGGLMPTMSRENLLKAFLKGEGSLLNPRLVPLMESAGDVDGVVQVLLNGKPEERAKKMATVMAVRGPFNVNSDSVEAWKAVLGSLRGKPVVGWNGADFTTPDGTAFPRMGMPIAGASDDAPAAGMDVMGAKRWAGYRALTDDEIDRLAKAIVEEIRARGEQDRAPFLSLAEFVNRRVGGANELHVMEGLLSAAIRKTGLNDPMHEWDSKDLSSNASMRGLESPEARTGKSGEGAPSMLTQGDLMMALAPVITVRGDTFRIRAYGESRDKAGKVQARAWCEAVVQRLPEYVDAADLPEVGTAELKREVNQRFGRRFVISSFRWVSPEEV